MNTRDYKIKLIEALKARDVFTDQPSKIQIRTRCPFCGDSQKDFRTGHLYLRINPEDDALIVYNCFKCPAHGFLKPDDLDVLGISDTNLKEGLSSLNGKASKYSSNSREDKHFDYNIPTNYDARKLFYVENRLGLHFDDRELRRLKVITSLKDFIRLNDIEGITCQPAMANLVEQDYVGFLSSNNSYILFRDITEKHKISWYKYPITNESRGQQVLYSVKSSANLYTEDTITINLSEGVMDCISIRHNIYSKSNDNILNFAVCGKFYSSVIRYLIGLGFVGSNIIINIFSDNDHTWDTSLKYYQKELKDFSFLVGEINIYYNTLYKDCGVPKSQISLQKYRI